VEKMTVQEIARAVQGEIEFGISGTQVNGVSTDSRTINKGDLFIPIKGQRYDGHDFVKSAIENGAACVLSEKGIGIEGNHSIIRVKDTANALKALAKHYRRKFNIKVVAVTGSTGKTTTKNIIAHVLSSHFNVLKTAGNYNNEIGLPLTVFNISPQHQVLVLEMGMSGFGEIAALTDIAMPDIAVITNIGVAHIEKLGSRDNILKAKTEIFNGFTDKGLAVLNGDDPYLLTIQDQNRFDKVYYSIKKEKPGFLTAYDIKTTDSGISFKVDISDKGQLFSIPVPGEHNVYNALAAIAVAIHLKVPVHKIKHALASITMDKGRMNIITTDDGLKIIDDCYNANPDSTAAAIRVLAQMGNGRTIAVLGDMLELGNYSEWGHRYIGQIAKREAIDILVCVGQNAAFIGKEAIKQGMPDSHVRHFGSNKDAIEYLKASIRFGDTILVKGSRGMGMEEIISGMLEGRK
jgi:UDP-N-acetylmuramoyl-tripeptide--D-alanyl-D-alanine ligase